jgi:uncharacterized lipoprotein YmbA
MKRLPQRKSLSFLCLLAAFGLAACSSAPTRFYTLAAPMEGTTAAQPLAAPVYVELAPLALPERLIRPELVVRGGVGSSSSSAKIEVLEGYQWASSFEYELRDALANRVARRLGGVNTTVSGRPAETPAWRVSVEVVAFDPIQDQQVDVVLSWSVRRTDGGPISTCRWSASEPVEHGIDALAAGAQRVTARAADAIARHIASLAAKTAPDCGA